jgi:hypothetical protein
MIVGTIGDDGTGENTRSVYLYRVETVSSQSVLEANFPIGLAGIGLMAIGSRHKRRNRSIS